MLNDIIKAKGDGCSGAIGASIAGVLIFLSAFLLIWFNEGRPNLAVVAADSLSVGAGIVNRSNEGQFLAVSGRLTASPLSDELFLAQGNYLQIERIVEMYAWVEKRDSETNEYYYDQKWTTSPENSEQFEFSDYYNPPLELPSGTYTAPNGRIGAFAVDLAMLDLPAAEQLELNRSVLRRGSQEQVSGNYIFRGFGTLERPEIGDIRISFKVVRGDREVTAFGEQQGERLEPYWSEKYDAVLYRALDGNRASAIEQLDTEHTITGWVLRGVSLLMLWGGLALALWPISALISVLPGVIRQTGGCALGLITFIPAFILWIIAEVIAIVAHNPWLLAATVLLVIVAGVLIARRWRPQTSPQPSLGA